MLIQKSPKIVALDFQTAVFLRAQKNMKTTCTDLLNNGAALEMVNDFYL